MRGLIAHLRYTIRQLLKSPGFTVTAVLILGLGIGANTAIFSLVNGVLLKPLPYPNADRLFHLYRTFKNDNTTDFDYPDFADYCTAQHSFSGLAAFGSDWFHLAGRGSAEQLPGLYVSGAFVKVMGRPLILGRPLDEADDRPGSAAVVVLSEHLWRTHFNSDPNIIGISIVLNSRSFQVVGITPGQADEGFNVELYAATNQDQDFAPNKKVRRGAFYYECVGRLRDGVTLPQAQTDLEVIQQNLIALYPATDAGFGIRIAPYLEGVVSDYATTVWLLEAAVASGLLPAWTGSRVNLASALNQEGERVGTSGRRQRSQAILVAVQVALSCLLLIGAGLLMRSLQAIQSVSLGFRTDHVLTAEVYLADAKYPTQAACNVFFDQLLEKVRQLPGVMSAALVDDLPFSGGVGSDGFCFVFFLGSPLLGM